MSITPVDKEIKEVTLPRPGHADLAGVQKYGFTDIRNVLERSSARETTMRVALGSVCRKLLEEVGIHIASRVVQIHNIIDTDKVDCEIKELNSKVDRSPVRCINKAIETQSNSKTMRAKMKTRLVGRRNVRHDEEIPATTKKCLWERRNHKQDEEMSEMPTNVRQDEGGIAETNSSQAGKLHALLPKVSIHSSHVEPSPPHIPHSSGVVVPPQIPAQSWIQASKPVFPPTQFPHSSI